MRYFYLLFILLSTFTISAQSSIQQLDSLLTQLSEDRYFSGNLLLAEGDNILLRKSYGYADFENKTPLKETAVLELASVSKQFTAAGISLLVNAKQLELDTPIVQYLPELAAYPTLTTRHLVHHMGGLPDYMDFIMDIEDKPAFVTNQFVLDYLKNNQLEAVFPPGERYEYSNTGYLVLGSLIERISGKSFGEYLKQSIFEPLGMENTQVYRRRYEKRQVPNFVPGYVQNPEGEFVNPDSMDYYSFVHYLDGVQGDGMVNSTLDDLYLWDRALAAGKLLDTSLLFTSGRLNSGDSVEYGFGFSVEQDPKYGYTINHSGSWPGMLTFIYRFPTTDRVLILLRNDDGGHSQRLNPLQNGLHALHGLPLELESLIPLEIKVTSQEQADELVGAYIISPTFKLDILFEREQLKVRATNQRALLLTATDIEDQYAVVDLPADLKFKRDENGKVTGLTLIQEGREVPAVKEE